MSEEHREITVGRDTFKLHIEDYDRLEARLKEIWPDLSVENSSWGHANKQKRETVKKVLALLATGEKNAGQLWGKASPSSNFNTFRLTLAAAEMNLSDLFYENGGLYHLKPSSKLFLPSEEYPELPDKKTGKK
jgi:hypothetical protein